MDHDIARQSSSPPFWRRLFGGASAEPRLDVDVARLKATLGQVMRDFCELELPLVTDDAESHARLGRLERFVASLDAASDAQLDWDGARRTFLHHRQAERAWATRTVGDFKQAMLDVAQRLGRTMRRDRGGDERVSRTMEVLRDQVQSPATDLSTLKHSVLHAVDVVESSARERRRRHAQELDALRDVLGGMRVELRRARAQATTDSLTGLANRSAFDQHLTGLAALGELRDVRTSLLLLDLDRFKAVNDTWGHPAGDAVLKAVADRICRLGTRDTDLIARIGGEELAIVLHECRQADAILVAERVRDAIKRLEVPVDDQVIRVTASIGVAERAPDEAPDALLARVDRALYSAKQQGRDRVHAAD